VDTSRPAIAGRGIGLVGGRVAGGCIGPNGPSLTLLDQHIYFVRG
jgi:hypothetical protein